MANRRGKTQARRNSGNGLPGWAWGVIGLVAGIVLILAMPGLLKSDGDGFLRPQPNPDARPAPVAAGADDVVAPEDDRASGDAAEDPEYDFYTLLPGREVRLSDAELAATERAEAQADAQQADARDEDPASALPRPVDDGDAPVTAAAEASDGAASYLLQAGAFRASAQAEELKARIALLGLSARVEAANIDSDTVYRVRMGPYSTAGELAEAKRKLEGGGLPAMAIEVR